MSQKIEFGWLKCGFGYKKIFKNPVLNKCCEIFVDPLAIVLLYATIPEYYPRVFSPVPTLLTKVEFYAFGILILK